MSSLYWMEDIRRSPHLSELNIETLIVAASSDCRAYEGARILVSQKKSISQLVVLHFSDQTISATDPLFAEYNSYTTLGIPYLDVLVPDDIIKLDPSLVPDGCTLLDITGFSIPDLFRTMYYFSEIVHMKNMHVLYSEPKHYIFGNDTFGSYSYFVGERQYRALEEFYISGNDGRELLTIFLGFDRMTSTIVKDAVDPTETVLVNGFPALTPKLKDVSLLNNRELIAIIGKPQHCVRTNNPFSTYNLLSHIQESHPDVLMNVCVLGTKAMALGAAIYALDKKSIKISYAYTKEHSPRISTGVSNTWYYNFTLLSQ